MKTILTILAIAVIIQGVMLIHVRQQQKVTYQLMENLYVEKGDHPELYFLNHPDEAARLGYTNGVANK